MRVVHKIILFGISLSLVLGTLLPSTFASDITVEVTARVPGCGDGVVDTGAGEECDGGDFNGASCQSLGYVSGLLSCTLSCTFDTSLCSMTAPPGGGSSGGGYLPPSLINTSFLIFTGSSIPGAEVFVLRDGNYFASGPVNAEGTFIITVVNPEEALYSFSFYSISSTKGYSETLFFSHFVQAGVVTRIGNIHFVFPIEQALYPSTQPEIIIPGTEEIPVTPGQPWEIVTPEHDELALILKDISLLGFCYFKESSLWFNAVRGMVWQRFFIYPSYFTVYWVPIHAYPVIEYLLKKVSP